ncbi:7235_t:CDS:2, partial [Acaulospora colombiana]
ILPTPIMHFQIQPYDARVACPVTYLIVLGGGQQLSEVGSSVSQQKRLIIEFGIKNLNVV